MTKQNTLQDRLARSLDKMNKREEKTTRPAAAVQQGGDNQKCKKISISLFQTDLAKLDGIRSFMETNGQRISASQAIKLALRTAPHSNELVKALAAIQAEDGRTKK
jgi:hypothetical protein